MYQQNNPEFLPIIQRLGCLYLSLAKMVSLETNHEFSTSDLNAVWLDSKTRHYIDYKNHIVMPDNIIKMLISLTDKKIVIAQVGQTLNGKTIFWNWYKDTKYDYSTEMLNTTGHYGTHWVLDDVNGNCIFDSYSFKEYKSEKSGRLVHYVRLV